MVKHLFIAVAFLGSIANANAQWVVETQPLVPVYTAPINSGWQAVPDQTTVRADGSIETVHYSQAKTYTIAELKLANQRRDATCSIKIGNNYGTGTCFAKKEVKGKMVGLVITCAHFFDPTDWDTIKNAEVKATFGYDNKTRSCQPLGVDWDHDLLALAVFVSESQPILPLAEQSPSGGEGVEVHLCGSGGKEHQYLCHTSTVKGYASVSWNGGEDKNVPAKEADKFKSAGHNQIYVSSLKRQGDSGGGIVNEDNELVGVMWGGTRCDTYGTYAGRIRKFLSDELPSCYQWTQWGCEPQCQPQYQPQIMCPPQYAPQYAPQPQYQQQQQQMPQAQSPQMVPLPGVPGSGDPNGGSGIPVPDQGPTEHEEMTGKLDQIVSDVAELKAGHDAIAQALIAAPTKEDLEGITNRLDALGQGQSQLNGAMGELQTKVNELAAKDATVTLSIESSRYISPSYVDVSVLWALQQKSGIDHMVLVTDTDADHWTRMQGEYEAAKEKFPAIILYDVRGKGMQFKELPQLVIYPTGDGAEPAIVKGTDGVAKVLQAITRGEMPSSFQGTP